ncbi:MAG: hypothetical protein GW795_06510 [Cyanobacteria bacterium]|uniref:hypothetical protein n=1 Tax=Geminocystis herdmanii TaxID=669359 RepID=UPI000377C2AF|nr:hypothetical protein [Geminocystis herdmanii]NCO74555.1 hypothetical protein [Cyanobacteria bacterium CG_2015-16_32_12]NCQ05291.1 hypothetical protein [Cyanobacteria bacterium CG_2015-09_32_10]NCQ41535.1 hypothetical protein [Cyanobacteria bacterium CG_2015-04_32_10]NCS85866.1 hypothetical protein [Cyanobacteria bacterium CG_2015-02_32_10]
MKNSINFCGYIVESSDFYSQYMPLISFDSEKNRETVNNYISNEADKFFKKLDINIIVSQSFITTSKSITDLEFQTIDITYFYEQLFLGLWERDNEKRLKKIVKWGVTFDKKCTPINSDTNLRPFGTIDINKTPVFYYLYFTMQEILDAVRYSDSIVKFY